MIDTNLQQKLKSFNFHFYFLILFDIYKVWSLPHEFTLTKKTLTTFFINKFLHLIFFFFPYKQNHGTNKKQTNKKKLQTQNKLFQKKTWDEVVPVRQTPNYSFLYEHNFFLIEYVINVDVHIINFIVCNLFFTSIPQSSHTMFSFSI